MRRIRVDPREPDAITLDLLSDKGYTIESVTLCDGCGSYRLTREYKGLHLCLKGRHCWKHRRSIVRKKG